MATRSRKSNRKKNTKRTARKKSTRKRSSSRSKKGGLVERVSNAVIRAEVLGIVLVVIAVITMLSLLTETRGAFTQAWISFLNELVGLGAWGVPIVTGAIGVWLIIRAIDQMPDMPWQRPAGILILFAAYLTATALLSKTAAQATSGFVGSQIANSLLRLTGNAGAWLAVAAAGVIGLVLLTDQLLVDAGHELLWRWRDWWRSRAERREEAAESESELSPPDSKRPWWRRWFSRTSGPDDVSETIIGKNISDGAQQEQDAASDVKLQRPQTQQALQPEPPASSLEPDQTPTDSTEYTADERPLSARSSARPFKWSLPKLDNTLADWTRHTESDDHIREQGRLIQETLALFGVPTEFEGAYKGPSVTQYLIKPGYVERVVRGEEKRVKVKVSKIAQLGNDIALALAAPTVRIEAPVPGTNYIGIEVPNQENNIVGLKELMQSDAYRSLKGRLPVALGEDVKGQAIVTDLARMPHLLIAGSTGSGKSVCINSIITCLLLTHTPDTLNLIMIDPKMVELNVYNGIPHLRTPVVTEVDTAAGVLFWAVKEMERRYEEISKAKARDIERYNSNLKNGQTRLPYIVIVVDEMADLMMAAPEEVEKHICRLAQMARAVGIHLIIATQRPSVNVITGLIKANFPARIAFAVSSQIDSRVILDVPGADRLLGRGDMLLMAPDVSKLARLQGAYLNDEEINEVVDFWRVQAGLDASNPNEDELVDILSDDGPVAEPDDGNETDGQHSHQASKLDPSEMVSGQQVEQAPQQPELFGEIERLKKEEERDELYEDAVRVVKQAGRGSVSLLQRKLRIGYGRSSRIVEQLEANGILGPDLGGSRGRQLIHEISDPSGKPIDAEQIQPPSGEDEKLISSTQNDEPIATEVAATTTNESHVLENGETVNDEPETDTLESDEDIAEPTIAATAAEDSENHRPQVWM